MLLLAHYYISENEIKFKGVAKMECIISGMLGMFIGMLIIAYITIGVINRKDRKISNQKAMIKNRDEVIDNQNEKIKLIKKAVVNIQILWLFYHRNLERTRKNGK